MMQMFYNCYLLINLDMLNFNARLVENMKGIFYNCSSLIALDLSTFDTSSVTDMISLFYNCQSLSSLKLSSNFLTSGISNMEYFFYNCSSLERLDLSSFDTSSVTNMEKMFYNCESLESLILSNRFDTSKISTMEQFFYNCKSLKLLNLTSFYTFSVSDMQQMFFNCQSLTSLDISGFNTENVLNMKEMFKNCYELTTLNLSNFDISKVTTMESMFEGDSNLKYINYKFFRESDDLNINHIFSNTPDDIVYCILDEENIPLELSKKVCSFYDCKANWLENKQNRFYNKKKDNSILYDKCVLKNIKEYSKNFYLSNQIVNTSIYSYKIDSSMENLKNENKNITFFDFSSEDIEFLMNYFGLDKEKENIYILISDSPSSDERSATSDYEYVLVLENGTELKLSDIKEDFYVEISVPIRDTDLANFDYALLFDEQGYDIYDISSDFYNDFCTPAFSGDNDIILSDRKKEIFPNNVTLCKSNCEYKSIDIESQRIICECNLNSNNNYSNEIDDFSEEEKDDGNFITYFIDKVNYKIFKCYILFLNFYNLNKNIAFYAISITLVITLSLSVFFLTFGLQKIRIEIYKELPSPQKVKEMILEELKKQKNKKDNKKANPNKKKSIRDIKIRKTTKSIISNKSFKSNNIRTKRTDKNDIYNKYKKSGENCNIKRKEKGSKSCRISYIFEDKDKKESKDQKNKRHRNSSKNIILLTGNYSKSKYSKNDSKNFSTNSKIFDRIKIKNKTSICKSNLNLKSEEIDDYNELPFTKALRVDKRNIFIVFKSILFDKLELISIFISGERIRIICICEYILSLLFDFFFNAFLYSDDVVSHKYHNNGELDLAVSFVISITSNIISSIICNFIEYSKGIEERFDEISKIKREYIYLYALNKFLRYLKIKMFLFIIIQIILVGGCFYYIVIFCIIYSKSQLSLLTNYFYSLLEGLITSLIVTFVIVVCRKIGIKFKCSYLYNTSKYLNEKF